MNILHIGKFYPPYHGGMESYLCDLAEAQQKQGHQVTVWVHNHKWQRLASISEKLHRDNVYVIRQKSLKPILFTPIMLGFSRQLNKIIDSQSPDLIHLHWPNPSLIHLLRHKQVKNIPWVMSWHSDMVTNNSSWVLKLIYKIIKPLESKLIKHADQILISTQNYADHSKQLMRNHSKVSVIPLGINTNKLVNVEHSSYGPSWKKDELRLLHIGRLTFYKNQSLLIKAMSKLHGAQLKIIGHGHLASHLKKQIMQLSIANVELLGALNWETVNKYLASCHIFCMASNDRAESFGVVLLEAMYHNKIILVPDTVGSGMSWLAQNYNKGFIYQVDNPKDFVAKILHIQENYTEITSRPFDFDYQIGAVADQIQTIYQKILGVTIDE